MKILGINIGHNATAALLKDGKIISCVSEERFSRIKNHHGIPYNVIANMAENNLDYVVVDDEYDIYEGNPDFNIILQNNLTFKNPYRRLKGKIGYHFPAIRKTYRYFRDIFRSKEARINKLKDFFSEFFGIEKDKVFVINHHFVHAYSCCFNLPRNKKTLIFTADGCGGGLSASVNIWDGKNMERIAGISENDSLAGLYANATLFLGMKVLQHEFKVMGLAPYAKKHYVDKVYPEFEKLIQVNGLQFRAPITTGDTIFKFEKEFKYKRFDIIAGCIQRLIEERAEEWIRNAIKETGIHDIALSGGLFMNVKCNQRISEMPEVNNIFVMPSCGDESNAIGCAFYGYMQFCKDKAISFEPSPITDLYLGCEYDNLYIEEFIDIEKLNLDKNFKITKSDDINSVVAELLADNKIVARCTGRSEWGARK